MKADLHKPERISGWALAAVMAVHLLVLRPSSGFLLAALALLMAGALLRGQQVYAPPWLGRILLLLGTVAVVVAQGRMRAFPLLGELAGMAGVMMLLRPVTPARGMRILLCLLVVLLASILGSFSNVGVTFVVLDVVALLILAEQIHRPPEVAVSFWVSLMRSLRVVVPVGAVVSLVFWLFPNMSLFTQAAFTGFAGDGVLNPGEIMEIAQSRRVALVARFAPDQPVPPAEDLYWRGQVLEKNEGLRWSRPEGRVERERFLQDVPPEEGAEVWRYQQDVISNRGLVPVLDYGVFVEARRNELDVVVQDIGASMLWAVGTGPLSLQVVSSRKRVADVPLPTLAGGALGVPREIAGHPALQAIADEVVRPGTDVPEKLRTLAGYFRDSGFRYTMRPGRVPDLGWFLLEHRRGFCEHYAAAAANLLRLGGVPARVVTGYRGGQWNPWLRTIQVRDANAHAWVEVWDEASRSWRRFDPTDHVAPDLAARLQREMDFSRWPWYQVAIRYGGTAFSLGNQWIEQSMARVTTSTAWEYLPPVLFGTLVLVALVWLVRNLLRRRMVVSPDVADLLLSDLERRALRLGRERKPGETPLAWLGRLEGEAAAGEESENLRDFARWYETGVYQAGGAGPDVSENLRRSARLVRQAWKQGARGT